MTVMYADTGQYLLDVFRSLGLGALLCFLFWPLSGVKSRVLAAVLWSFFGALAAFLTCCFICGATFSKTPRWFIFLGIAVGWRSCRAVVLPPLEALLRFLSQLLFLPFRLLSGVFAKLLAPVFGILLKLWEEALRRLKNLPGILYNLTRKNNLPPRGTSDGPKAHKEPIKAAPAP